MFVHKLLRYTYLDQLPPISEIKWLCLDVDGYKIVNVYKLSPMRSLTSQCFLTFVSVTAISTVATLIGVTMISMLTVNAWLAGKVLIVFSYYKIPYYTAGFYSSCWKTSTNLDLAFASVGSYNSLTDRIVF